MAQVRQERPCLHPPLVQSYLDTLDRALAEAAPSSRDEVMARMHDHADDYLLALPSPAQQAELEMVLRQLGTVEEVLATVPLEDSAHVEVRPGAQAPSAARGWPAISAAVLAGLGLLATFVFFPVVPPLQLVGLLLLVLVVRRTPGRPWHRTWVVALVLTAVGLFISVLMIATLFSAGGGTVIEDLDVTPAPGPYVPGAPTDDGHH